MDLGCQVVSISETSWEAWSLIGEARRGAPGSEFRQDARWPAPVPVVRHGSQMLVPRTGSKILQLSAEP